jgi:hypothetical protein
MFRIIASFVFFLAHCCTAWAQQPSPVKGSTQPSLKAVFSTKDHRDTYVDGEFVVFEFRPEIDCYVHLFVLNSKGEVSMLFPNTYDKNNFVPGYVTFSIPHDQHRFSIKASQPTGNDLLCALVTSRDMDLRKTAHRTTFDSFVQNLHQRYMSHGSTHETVSKGFVAVSREVLPLEWNCYFLRLTTTDRSKANLDESAHWVGSVDPREAAWLAPLRLSPLTGASWSEIFESIGRDTKPGDSIVLLIPSDVDYATIEEGLKQPIIAERDMILVVHEPLPGTIERLPGIRVIHGWDITQLRRLKGKE